MLYYQPTDYILQCHDISHFLPVFETDTLPASYQCQSLHNHQPVIQNNLGGQISRNNFEHTQSTLGYIKQEPIQKTHQHGSFRIIEEPRVVPVKVEHDDKKLFQPCIKQEGAWDKRNCEQNFALKADPLLQRVLGRSKKPYLYAVCLAAILKAGVHREGDTFVVINDRVFMTAVSVLSQYKQKRPRDTYGAYKSIKRWATVIDKRRKGNCWRFKPQERKKDIWMQIFEEIKTIISLQPNVTWPSLNTGQMVKHNILSREFAEMISVLSSSTAFR